MELRRRKGLLIVHSLFFSLKKRVDRHTHIDHTCDISKQGGQEEGV